jgi:hypothetical protein
MILLGFVLITSNLKAQPNYAGPDKVICAGECVELGITPSNTNCTYLWLPTTGMAPTSQQNSANPTVCPTTTTTYTVTVSDETTIYTDQVTVTVGSSDLQIFKPKVIAGNTVTSILEADEESIGAMSFMNLDNDDKDNSFDNNDSDVSGGDNELMKLVIKTTPAISSMQTVKLLATQGVNNIKVWRREDKTGGQYNLGDDIILTVTSANENIMELWIEGIIPHNKQQGTILELKMKSDDVICESDKVAITIVGVNDMTWRGMGNGYTPGSFLHNNVELDTDDPNFPSSLAPIVSHRVFSGARSPNVNFPMDIVELHVNLTVAPTEGFRLYLKAFDTDDPFVEQVLPNAGFHVDPNDNGGNGMYPGTDIPYTEEEDNRGLVSQGTTASRAGILMDTNDNSIQDNVGIGMVTFVKNDSTNKVLHFKVSEHPGDNYRVAANADKGFIDHLRNTDITHGISIADQNAGNIQQELLYTTHILTVWRILHIENESMLNYNWQYNTSNVPQMNTQQRISLIKDFASLNVPQVGSSVDELILQSPISDGSSDLTTGGNGRFENGSMIIGLNDIYSMATPLPNSIIIGGQGGNTITGNGTTFVRFQTPQSISGLWGEMTSPVGGVAFNVVEITKNGMEFIWEITGFVLPTGMILTNFIGEQVKIGGGLFIEITDANDVASTITTDKMRIPFILRDDDRLPTDNILPHTQDLAALTIAFEQAYILPQNDGGGNIGNNANNLPFIENIYLSTQVIPLINAQRASYINETPHFWVAYVTSTWQGNNTQDADANQEATPWGGTFPSDNLSPNNHISELSIGGDISYINRELVFDQPALLNESQICAHEVGHQFGLTHEAVGMVTLPESPIVGVMGSGDSWVLGNNGMLFPLHLFIPRHLNLIRSRVNSPGE